MTLRSTILGAVLFTILTTLLLAPLSGSAQDRASLIEMVSGNAEWMVEPEPNHYTGAEIDGMITGWDSAAIRDYGARGVSIFDAVRTEPQTRVRVTLFEMFDSAAAFGLFALDRNWRADTFTPAAIGIESYRQSDRLVIWQSNYVAVLDVVESAESGSGQVDDLATLLTDNMIGDSRKASVSTLLPGEGLIRDSEQYILDPDAFNRATGLDPPELGFENSVEAAVAEYAAPNGATSRLAMLLYPTQHLAAQYLDMWVEETGTEYPYRRTGPLVGIVLDGSDDALVQAILDGLRYESEVTWNQPMPDLLTLPYMILTIFSWIGIALTFTLVVGLGFGGFRIYMKTRYPERFLGASPNSEMIQLNIHQPVTRKELNS